MKIGAGNDAGSDQQYLIQLWREVLNRSDVGTHDDFFAAGGSSMQVIEMLMTVSDRFAREIDYVEFFKEPNIQRLSDLLGSHGGASAPAAQGGWLGSSAG
jgi:acyl carrier protein